VVLMDLKMPEMDGLASTRAVRKRHPQVQVVALTNFWEKEPVQEVLQAGAIGYLLKNMAVDGLAAAIHDVPVVNVAPTVESPTVPVEPVNINDQGSFSVNVTFSDPAGANDQPYTCDFDLDYDGVTFEGDASVSASYDSCSTPLNYEGPGVYTVMVIVTDKDGGSDSATATEYLVIYDPEGGFVTGGGWIMSSAEACPWCDVSPEAKANFGFVSKYKKGASEPTGQTEFQFKAGDLNFHSDSYDWLVIAGANAKYKGLGTVNGGGNYGFMLTATDAALTPSTDVDLFRIQIWDKDDHDETVYDNKMGESDDGYAGTEIGGGNIKIHKAKM
jgi:hypothetical protein